MTNLILTLKSSPNGMTSEQIRHSIDGYAADETDEAFSRKFRRDRKTLSQIGLSIVTDDSFPPRYSIDSLSSFQDELRLSPKEIAALRLSAKAALSNPGFFSRNELASALGKIYSSSAMDGMDACDISKSIVEKARLINDALHSNRTLGFAYVDRNGISSKRTVKGSSLFSYLSDWYLHAFDVDANDMRTFKLDRMSELEAFECETSEPDDSIATSGNPTAFPFQIGQERFEAKIYFGSSLVESAIDITWGKGVLEDCGNGFLWTIEARNRDALIEWAISNGPGILIVEPEELAKKMRDSLLNALQGGESA